MLNVTKNIKNSFASHLMNIPGWRTNRKIVVFESDDWGAIRMPSKEAYQRLLEKGIRVDRSSYNRVDTLENRDDLERLFELLAKFRDSNGNHPVITFNTVMGNPDFEKIRDSGFEEYHHEHFRDTYRRYYSEDLFPLWRDGMKAGVMRPQFHGREHLNVSLWMKALQQGHRETMDAFSEKFYGLRTDTPSKHQKDYLAAFWADGKHDLFRKAEILKEGLNLFEKTFGLKSDSFIACNYVMPREMEQKLFKNGISIIQGQRGQYAPDVLTGDLKIRRAYTGQKNVFDQIYLVRNCFFEPKLNQNFNSVDICLNEIRNSFLWKKPAIISSHRINFVSGLNAEINRKSLKDFEQLILSIIEKWPEVEFLSTDQIGKIIKKMP